MSTSPAPNDAAASMRWQRWQERGVRRDTRDARIRMAALIVLALGAGTGLFITVSDSRAARTATEGVTLTSPSTAPAVR